MAKKKSSPKRFADTVTKKKIINSDSDTENPANTSPAKSPSSEPKSKTPKTRAQTPKKSATLPQKGAKKTTNKTTKATKKATKPEVIDPESITDDVASSAHLEEIRAAIADGPTQKGWSALLSAFKSWDTKAAEYDAGLQYAMEHINDWPDALRTFTYQKGDEHAPWLPLCRGMTLKGKSLPDDLPAMLQKHAFVHLALLGAPLSFESLKQAKALKSLHLEGYTKSLTPIASLPALTSLSLTSCKEASELFEENPTWVLEELCLSDCDVSPWDDGFMEVCESLKKLSLENMKREYSTYDLSEFSGCKELTHLSLKDSGTDWKPVEGVLHILQYLPKLTYLDLTNASLWENVASGYSEDYGGFIDQKVYTSRKEIKDIQNTEAKEVRKKIKRLRKMLDEVEKDPSFSSWERISSEFVDAFRSNYGMRYDSCIE